ncbi:MAG: hypothetical protein ABI811_10775 [Acidobacteriota bacterium]
MNQSIPREGYQSRIRATTLRLAIWTFAWVVTCAFMNFGPKFLWDKAIVFTVLAIALNVGVGAGMILANKNYIMGLDELQRKVYLNALAITVGVGLIAGVPFEVMDTYDVISFHAKISHLVMIMSLTFVVSILYGSRRYR